MTVLNGKLRFLVKAFL